MEVATHQSCLSSSIGKMAPVVGQQGHLTIVPQRIPGLEDVDDGLSCFLLQLGDHECSSLLERSPAWQSEALPPGPRTAFTWIFPETGTKIETLRPRRRNGT